MGVEEFLEIESLLAYRVSNRKQPIVQPNFCGDSMGRGYPVDSGFDLSPILREFLFSLRRERQVSHLLPDHEGASRRWEKCRSDNDAGFQ